MKSNIIKRYVLPSAVFAVAFAAGCIVAPDRNEAVDTDALLAGEVRYRGEVLEAIDMHLHTGSWDNLPEHMQEILRASLPFPLNLVPSWTVNFNLSSLGIANQLRESGFQKGVLFAVYAPATVGLTTNEFVANQIASMPHKFYGMASVPADHWETNRAAALGNLEAHLRRPEFIGVKMAHPHMGIAFNDEKFDPVYEIAGRYSKPVFVHTGNTPAIGARTDPEATDPAYLEGAIARHPQTRFILGHMGYNFLEKELGYMERCLDLADRYPNVYLEASALGSTNSDPEGRNLPTVLRTIKARGLIERLVYGSDGPQQPGFLVSYRDRMLTAMDAADYSVEEARLVFKTNFLTIFGL